MRGFAWGIAELAARGGDAGRRRALAGVGVLIAAFASLATTDIECPQAISLADAVQLEPNASSTHRYHVASSGIQRVRVILSGTSDGTADVRALLVPDDPTLFEPDPLAFDAGGNQSAERALALRPLAETTAEITLPRCTTPCEAYDFSLFLEHIAGDRATLRWDVILETESCDDFHARIDRR
jgi:hypothetical protein